ncbi:MAG: nitrile hydratase accessory protein [Chloroflexota bacterium]
MPEKPDRQIADMDGTAALPRKNGELVFNEAWEGRVFGMAVAMSEGRQIDWEAFRQQLIAEIGSADQAGSNASYYERWLSAFERLLDQQGLIHAAELATRTAEFESGARDDVY